METNIVYNEDCIQGLKRVPDNSVDLVVTSPPYNKNGFRNGKKDTGCSSSKYKRWDGAKIEYDLFDDNMKEDDYKNWQIQLLNELYRILKPTGSLFYNHKVRRFESRADHPLVWLSKSKLHFYQQIIWDRGGAPDQNINYCTPSTELILWFVKDIPKVFKKKDTYFTEVWRFNPANSEHPAPFPEKLPFKCIKLTTQEGDIVLDPFMGSGTTAVVCKQLNRQYIGFEISPEYCKTIEKRLSQKIMTSFFETLTPSQSEGDIIIAKSNKIKDFTSDSSADGRTFANAKGI
jgi:site-specific DNA-methyltransferase (adenine-specific)